MPITIADVAARAGVSKTTVSRVLNGKGEVDASTAARVRQVIDELGYVPSARAVSLARGRTRVIGMLVPSLIWPWMGEVAAGRRRRRRGGGLRVAAVHLQPGRRVDAAVRRRRSPASPSTACWSIEPEGTLDYLADLHARGLPVVLIDDRGHQPLFPSVGDHQPGRRGAARPGTCSSSAGAARW